MTHLITRAAAKREGLTRYFTGEPCIRGHISERHTVNGDCNVCACAKKRAYKRLHASTVNAANQRYRRENLEAAKAREAGLRIRNAEQMRKNAARYRASELGRTGHAARESKRRSDLLQRTPSWSDANAIQEVYVQAARLTAETGVPHDVDHVFPLKGKLVSGLHVANNLRPIHASINRRKHNKFDPDCVGD